MTDLKSGQVIAFGQFDKATRHKIHEADAEYVYLETPLLGDTCWQRQYIEEMLETWAATLENFTR